MERRNELIAEGKDAFVNQSVFYNAKNVFYLSEVSRWDYLMENAKQNDIAIKIDAALAQVEKDNPALKGALPSNYYSGLGLDRTKLASLLDVIGKIDTQKDEGTRFESDVFTNISWVRFCHSRRKGEKGGILYTQDNRQSDSRDDSAIPWKDL